jgi:hypothetical protein
MKNKLLTKFVPSCVDCGIIILKLLDSDFNTIGTKIVISETSMDTEDFYSISLHAQKRFTQTVLIALYRGSYLEGYQS